MKTPEERGPFPTWVVEVRNSLDLTSEQVAAATGYDDATIRKLEGGQVTRPQRRKVTEYLQRVATEKGMRIPPPPGEVAARESTADLSELVSAIRAQTAVMADLVEALRAQGQGLSPEAVTLFLRQLVSEGLITRPEAMPSIGEPLTPNAGR